MNALSIRFGDGRVRPWLALLLWLASIAGPQLFAAVHPLKVSDNGRTLVDQDDTPFLLRAESPWSLIVGLKREEVDMYLDDRRQKGFNALIFNLIEHAFAGAFNAYGPPYNWYGDAPFTTPGDFTTPNEAYFAHADWVIDRAIAKGFLLILNPCYLGYPGTTQGWYQEVLSAGTEPLRNYGRFVGARYQNRPQILWSMVGDRNPDDARPMVEAMVAGMKEEDEVHLFGAHCFPEASPRGQFPDSPWLSLNYVYTYGDVHPPCFAAYQAVPVMPFVQFESAYENDFLSASPSRVRLQAYSSLLAGACGYGYGNYPVWLFNPGWQSALNSPGAISMKHLHTLFLSRAWFRLVPDIGHTVVTSGYALPWVACARADDGATVICYLSEAANPIALDMTKVSGSEAKAWWFNPRDGSSQFIGTFPCSGTHNFTSPTADDWVLLLDDASKSLPAPVPLGVQTSSLGSTQTGATYGLQLEGQGGLGPYSWSLAPGSDPLPAGLLLSAGGFLSGTSSNSGSFNLIFQITDALSSFAIQTLTLSITPGTLQIVTPSLVPGKRKVAYSVQFAGNGGTGPYTWALASGSPPLPGGLTLSTGGLLGGLPSSSGFFNFTVEVADLPGIKTQKAFALTVDPVLITLCIAPQSASEIPASGFKLRLSIDAPSTVLIEFTSNFDQWLELSTVEYSSGVADIIDLGAAASSARFYRASQP